MENTLEYWMEVLSHTEKYAAEVAEQENISGSLQDIVRQVKEIAKNRIAEIKTGEQ